MALTKALIENCDTKAKINCMFNPTEYTVAKSNSWKPQEVVGKNVPKMTFAGGGSRSMSLELFLDSYETGQTLEVPIKELWALALIDDKTKNARTHRARPPLCIFQWGTSWSFKAVVESLSIRYTLFRQDGAPVRATVSVTLREAEDVLQQKGTNPTSHSKPGYKSREVRPHDTLALIAHEEYGESGLWRRIAEVNELDDPEAISPGMVLAIPPRG